MEKHYLLHLLRVAKLVRNFCRLYFKNEMIANVGFMCGFTHDIGKLQVDQSILNKKDKLSDEEFENIKEHSKYSYELLKEAGLEEYGIAAMCHHERYDGLGYPKGLKGDEIPILAKIIAICDVFDAMTSERVYRDNAISRKDVLAFIEENIGRKFDPNLSIYFIENIENILFEKELENCITAYCIL